MGFVLDTVLPLPRVRKDVVSVEEALLLRRSIRSFVDQPVSIEALSQLLWACYGLSNARGFKTTPSAGATYPLEIYVIARPGGVKFNDGHLEAGIYRYIPENHTLKVVKKGDYSKQLMKACLQQRYVGEANFNIVLVAVFERTTAYYGSRGERYVWIEVGHAAQNVYLEATALGLGCVAIGAYYDDEVSEIIGLKRGETPSYILSIGVPKKKVESSERELQELIIRNRGG